MKPLSIDIKTPLSPWEHAVVNILFPYHAETSWGQQDWLAHLTALDNNHPCQYDEPSLQWHTHAWSFGLHAAALSKYPAIRKTAIKMVGTRFQGYATEQQKAYKKYAPEGWGWIAYRGVQQVLADRWAFRWESDKKNQQKLAKCDRIWEEVMRNPNRRPCPEGPDTWEEAEAESEWQTLLGTLEMMDFTPPDRHMEEPNGIPCFGGTVYDPRAPSFQSIYAGLLQKTTGDERELLVKASLSFPPDNTIRQYIGSEATMQGIYPEWALRQTWDDFGLYDNDPHASVSWLHPGYVVGCRSRDLWGDLLESISFKTRFRMPSTFNEALQEGLAPSDMVEQITKCQLPQLASMPEGIKVFD